MRKLVLHLPIKKPWEDPRYFFGSPTYRQCKKVAWYRFKVLIPGSWIRNVSNSELSIETVFGSELFLVGLDRPERIEGLILDGGVIDENSDIRPGTFDLSILPTLAWRKGWTDFIGIPKRFGIGAAEYKLRCDKAAKGELPDSAVFQWPSRGIVPEDFLKMCRATMDERDYAEQFDATWLSNEGGVFHAFNKEYNVRPCEYKPDSPILVGSDFNVNPMCWLFCHERGDTLEVFDELFMRNTNTPVALKAMLSRYADHKGGFEMYGDASSRGRHTSAYSTDYNHIASDPKLQSMGRTMHYLRSNPPVADRFAATNARICSGDGTMRVYISPTCRHLINDLEMRTYKPGTRETDDGEDVGHMTDAFGYVIYYKWPLKLRLPKSNTIIITKGAQ